MCLLSYTHVHYLLGMPNTSEETLQRAERFQHSSLYPANCFSGHMLM